MISRCELQEFYALYTETLDDVRLAEWPEFFTEECLFRIIPRENFEAGRTLCTMQAESRGMLIDRVVGLTRTQVYAPRYYRRFLSNLRIIAQDAGGVRTRQNVLVVQTLLDKQSEIVLCGVAFDYVVIDAGRMRFRERVIAFDSEMIPNSLVYPA